MIVLLIVVLVLQVSKTSGLQCFDCTNSTSLSDCALIDANSYGHLGCLIEIEDPDDSGLRVRKISSFCPQTLPECSNLTVSKHVWLTFVWKMHDSKTKFIRKNPILRMWFECFHDKCNDPEYVQSLLTLNVSWNIPFASRAPRETVLSNTTCYVCSNQSEPFVCTGTQTCSHGCKVQGFRLNTNSAATRLLKIYNVEKWQPQCNDDLLDYQASSYSLNGYMINNLNEKQKNMAVEAYCVDDNCNEMYKVSEVFNTAEIHLQHQPWFSNHGSFEQKTTSLSVRCIALFLLYWLTF